MSFVTSAGSGGAQIGAAAQRGSGSVGPMDLSPRLRAVCDLNVAEMREMGGRHEYDGQPQDLSPDGVRTGLARLAAARAGGEHLADGYDEALLTAGEDLRQVIFADLELHRRNAILH